MATVGGTTPTREFIDAVNRAIMAIGEDRIGTLIGSASKRVLKAMNAVIDARDEIYYHTKWEFRRGYIEIVLVEDQMWYEVPADCGEMATGLTKNVAEWPLTYLNYDNLVNRWPELRTFPPGSGVGNLTVAGQASAQTRTKGTPESFTIHNGYIGLVPIPDAEFVDDQYALYGTYWKNAPTLVSDYDDIGLPPELFVAHSSMALGYLKQALKYDDWESDYALGQKILRRQSSGLKMSVDKDVNQSDSLNYNE